MLEGYNILFKLAGSACWTSLLTVILSSLTLLSFNWILIAIGYSQSGARLIMNCHPHGGIAAVCEDVCGNSFLDFGLLL